MRRFEKSEVPYRLEDCRRIQGDLALSRRLLNTASIETGLVRCISYEALGRGLVPVKVARSGCETKKYTEHARSHQKSLLTLPLGTAAYSLDLLNHPLPPSRTTP